MSVPPEEVTLGTVWWRLGQLDRRMDDGFKAVQATIGALGFVPLARYEAEKRESDRRIDQLEEKNRWLARTLAAAIIGLVITIATTFISIKGG